MALGLTKLMSVEALAAYFGEELQMGVSAYYGCGRGIWLGKVAERIGLHGEVTKEAFLAVMSNEVPGSDGKRLTARKNGMTTETKWEWDEEQQTSVKVTREKSNHRVGLDMTFSLTKEESLLAVKDKFYVKHVVMPSLKETLDEIERDSIQVRVRDGGAHENRLSGEGLFAVFIHEISRPTPGLPPDPHWHAHVVAANVATDPGQDHRLKAAEMELVFARRGYYEARWHARCSERGIKHNYGYRRTDDGLKISVVERETSLMFSKRTREIEAEDRRTRQSLERRASAIVSQAAMNGQFLEAKAVYLQLRNQLGKTIRQGKDQITLHGEQRENAWKKEAGEGVLEKIWEGARNGDRIGFLDAEVAKAMAIEHAFQNDCVIRDEDLFISISIFGAGTMTVADMDHFCESDPRLVRNPQKPGRVTTWEIVREEESIRDLVKVGEGKYLGISEEWTDKEKTLDPGQAEAVRRIMASKDLVFAVPGYPGAGKSRTVSRAARAIKEMNGEDVLVLAPTGRSRDALAKDTGSGAAYTIAKFRESKDLQKRATGSHIFTDEFSLIPNADEKWLLEYALANGKQLVQFGDPHQYRAIGRGSPVGDLLQAGLIQFEELTNIYRQKKNPELLALAMEISEGRYKESVERCKKMGWIDVQKNEGESRSALVAAMVDNYMKGKGVLTTAYEHRQGEEICREVRQKLKELGALGAEDVEVTTLRDVQMTDAKRGDSVNHREGYMYKFHRAAPGGITSGQEWMFSRMEGEKVIGSRNGVEKEIPLSAAESFRVYVTKPMSLTKGDQLLATRNDPSLGVNTGDMVRVEALDGRWMTLSTGKRVDITRGVHFRQGYTVTGHASQSDQKYGSFLFMPASAYRHFNQTQWRVGPTRAQSLFRVFTDSLPLVEAGVVRPAEQESALGFLANSVDPDRKAVTIDLQEHARKSKALIQKCINLGRASEHQNDIEPPGHEIER
jgi:conjugative relaxase-like TrwC/TraI family protein